MSVESATTQPTPSMACGCRGSAFLSHLPCEVRFRNGWINADVDAILYCLGQEGEYKKTSGSESSCSSSKSSSALSRPGSEVLFLGGLFSDLIANLEQLLDKILRHQYYS